MNVNKSKYKDNYKYDKGRLMLFLKLYSEKITTGLKNSAAGYKNF